jgi:hypothetical protein
MTCLIVLAALLVLAAFALVAADVAAVKEVPEAPGFDGGTPHRRAGRGGTNIGLRWGSSPRKGIGD